MADLGRIIIVVNLLCMFAFFDPNDPLRYGLIAVVIGLTALGLMIADILVKVSKPPIVSIGLHPMPDLDCDTPSSTWKDSGDTTSVGS